MILDTLWYRRHPARWLLWLLWLLSVLYGALVALRCRLYRHGILKSERLPVPVIVVGNISVGGTGKTPLVITLVEQLRARGWKPGIVTRGYGGHSAIWPRAVHADSDPAEVGDEPVLLAQSLKCPIVAAPDRVAAARQLLAGRNVDIIVADDGLQHYRLQRDIEIVVIDGQRGLGNGLLLPAGPLREPPARLRSVDLVLSNGGSDVLNMELAPQPAIRLDGAVSRPLTEFAGRTVHAVAGIGHPARFFELLRNAGLRIEAHPFPDHHAYRLEDLRFPDNNEVIMTAKDAVKCRHFAARNHWYLPVVARLSPAAQTRLDQLLQDLPARIDKTEG